MHIRLDHDNKLGLRRRMKCEDMRSIHKAVRQQYDVVEFGEFLLGWLAKVLHEEVYTVLPHLRSLIRLYHHQRYSGD